MACSPSDIGRPLPCIFCIAVFAAVAGALTAARLDQMEQALAAEADGDVERTVDSASTTAFEADVRATPRGPVVPVTVTVYKPYQRVRIQLRSHALDRAGSEALQDRLAEALGLRIVERSDPAEEAPVRQAVEQMGGLDPAPGRVPERRRERGP